MLGVVQHQLKRVFPGWQINERLDFTFAEMNGPPIERDRLVGIEGSIHVNQQMVMAAFGGVVARSDNTHVAQAKAAQECAFDDRTILRRDDVQRGVLWSRYILRRRETGRSISAARSHACARFASARPFLG
jgi:hypothetical protein